MTYCLGILTQKGLVMASDSRTNAGYDQVNVHRKMYTFVRPGERVLVILASGNLSITQSVLALLQKDWEQGQGLAQVTTLYDAAREIGAKVRAVSEMDRAALENDDFKFNINLLLGGQIKGEKHGLYLVYPQGNPLSASEDSPYLQIGETKYGRPILDRGVRYDQTTLAEAAKFALISLDSTMRSNLTVGPPVDLVLYSEEELDILHQKRFLDNDPELLHIRSQWEQTLRQGIRDLPELRFWTDCKP